MEQIPYFFPHDEAQDERFSRLMSQHQTMKSEERHRIILWLISLTFALLSLVELLQLVSSLRKKDRR